MTDVAFAPTWQRAPNRRVRLLAVVFALVLLGYASGPRLIVRERDFTCPEGQVAVPASIMAGVYRCDPDLGLGWTRTVPSERYYGLFLTRLEMRVFDNDVLGGGFHGPALGMPVR